ncbi:SMP-30/gluconolactonase/LRE family protein [Amaricoccus tamworthensis]|uniref:SMP-30/gluconolactonase/LRE family protein n=1 Tax=Amaricoccus tamworthensis TaxID=57002 RepID=UPI003C7D58C4
MDSAELEIATAAFEPLSTETAKLGESPVWSEAHNAVFWVDIDGGQLLRTRPDGETRAWTTPEIPGFVQVVPEGIMVGMETGIFRFDEESAEFTRLVSVEPDGKRFNDACTDSQGRIWAGTMDMGKQHDNGIVYLFDPKRGTLTPRLDGFRIINGLAWDGANSRLFLSDSWMEVQTVWTCSVDAQDNLSDRREFARFQDLDGRPDGGMLDRDGNYWIAGVFGGVIYRFSPDGTEMTTWAVPVEAPTKPALLPCFDRPAMVLTSFADEGDGGRLAIWKDAPV